MHPLLVKVILASHLIPLTCMTWGLPYLVKKDLQPTLIHFCLETSNYSEQALAHRAHLGMRPMLGIQRKILVLLTCVGSLVV